MDAAVVLLALVGLAGASMRWGHESRSGFDPSGYDEVRGRIGGLLAEARRHSQERRGRWDWRQRAGVWLVEAGRRLQSYGESLVMPARLSATSDGSIHRGL